MFKLENIHAGSSDELLMAAIVTGHRNAFELLYDRWFQRLLRFAGRFMDDLQQAEDIAQEVFIKIIDKPENFDTDKKFSTWVYTLTANACKNLLRNEQNRARLLEEHLLLHKVEGSMMHHRYDLQVLKGCIAKALAEMNEKEKGIYLLRFEQHLSLREVAEILAVPEGSVKSGIYYLLRKLSKHLKEFNYEQ